MWKFFLVIAATTATLALTISCQRDVPSGGNEKEIIVIADSADYVFLKGELSRAFEREIPTPWPEKTFELHQVPVSQMEKHLHHSQLLLIGMLGSAIPRSGAAGKIEAMLTPELKARIVNGQDYVLKKDDPWAKEQRLVVLAATHRDTLKQRILSHRYELFELFNQPLMERTKTEMFSQFEQKHLEKTLLDKYDWTLRIQHDYQLYKEFPQENFVMLRRAWPERWLFASWQNLDDPNRITRDWVIEWRNRLGERFYENDRVVINNDLIVREVDFAGRWALELQGLWENESKAAGGPFKAWAFYDEQTRQAFLVDIAVFNPGKEKIRFLRQLEIMARTFRMKDERITERNRQIESRLNKR
ncbi:DUF4837 family protein [candidate division KSB1 bacterium]|nr:DUF4837 family protein [candidate division KSB1 bacterium]